ncbi:MAG TPA: hypothetical protein VN040_05200 [Pseudosphingobacterium sp.]|nr:hypothetical protein [Pseudosphingobacterium sp.]
MKILEKYSTLVNYSINLPCLNRDEKLSTNLYAASKWLRDEKNTFILIYDTFFEAKGIGDQSLITYHHQLELCCTFDIIENDAIEIVQLKRQANIAMKSFLENNMKSFFYLLDFSGQRFSNEFSIASEVKNEVKSINRIMSTSPFEEMSEEQKKLARMSHPFSIIIVDGK